MKIISRSAVMLIVLCRLLTGYGRTLAEESIKSESPKLQVAALQQHATLEVTATGTVFQGSQKKTATAETKQVQPKDVIMLRGSPLGAVKFEHKLHSQVRSTKCENCHHPSRSEMPATALQQPCSDCHTKVALLPMKTKLQAAFHNPNATAGTCINCHKTENAKGKMAPVKCLVCHKKENT